MNCHIHTVLSFALFAATAGCAESEAPSLGTLSVNLVGHAASGAVYRLRDATITVEGASVQLWHTEDDPTRTTLSADVAVGSYTATLQPGWRLERIGPTSATTVDAELTSVNPAPFNVATQARTVVPLNFRIDDDTVEMSQGYDIVVTVDEPSRVLELSCSMSYLCSRTSCNGIVVDSFSQTFTGTYLDVTTALGDQATPYQGFIVSRPRHEGELDTGFFDMTITSTADPTGPGRVITESDVSVRGLDTGDSVLAGLVESSVAPFVYQGQSYDDIFMLCTVQRLE